MTYSKSILQEDTDYCYVCGRYGTEIHHIFFGTANRKISDKYGLVVGLCYDHHRGKHGVHNGNRELDIKLKQIAQRTFTDMYSEDQYFAIFGRNYL